MPRPYISLTAMVQAAYTLMDNQSMPAPHGINTNRLVKSDGMRPWVRLALGEQCAQEIEQLRLGGWCMEAMLGVMHPHRQILDFDEAERNDILLVERLCEEAEGTLWGAFWCLKQMNLPLQGLLEIFEANEVNFTGRKTKEFMEELLGVICQQNNIVPIRNNPMQRMWKEHTQTAIVKEVHTPEYYRDVSRKYGYAATLNFQDGSQEQIWEDDRLTWPWEFAPRVNEVVYVTRVGMTQGHHGYLSCVQIREVYEYTQRQQIMENLQSITQQMDEENNKISVTDSVALTVHCLEAPKGSIGIVREILGNMVMVKFDNVRKMVPCYGHALKVLELA